MSKTDFGDHLRVINKDKGSYILLKSGLTETIKSV